jgi:hypothetical protein
LLETIGNTSVDQLSALVSAALSDLSDYLSVRLRTAVILDPVPITIEIPGSCLAYYYNDGNLSDEGCGRGCANCPVGDLCFTDADCLSGGCSTGVASDPDFQPILDADDAIARTGFRGECLETVSETTSAATGVSVLVALLISAINIAFILYAM